MFNYLQWHGEETFLEAPPTPVDFLIFALLSYCPMELLPPKAQGQPIGALYPLLYPRQQDEDGELKTQRSRLFGLAGQTPRFADIPLKRFYAHFDADQEKQFAAALFELDAVTALAAFRGTDSTVVGWKEDFNMSFESPVPAQTEAVAFLTESCQQYPNLYACGHSKGGNLAVYGAAHLPPGLQRRIMGVYSFDGPGVDDQTFQSPEYAAISGRIHSYVPESSVVGMLLNYHRDYTVIDTAAVSLQQHNPFTWRIRNGQFVVKTGLTAAGIFADRTLHDFLQACTKQERKTVVDTLYDLILATRAKTVGEIPLGLITHLPAVLAAIRSVPEGDRAVLIKTAKSLVAAGGSNLGLLLGLGDLSSGDGEQLPM